MPSCKRRLTLDGNKTRVSAAFPFALLFTLIPRSIRVEPRRDCGPRPCKKKAFTGAFSVNRVLVSCHPQRQEKQSFNTSQTLHGATAPPRLMFELLTRGTSRSSCRCSRYCHMLTIFGMKAIVGFVEFCLLVAAASLPAAAANQSSAAGCETESAPVALVEPQYLYSTARAPLPLPTANLRLYRQDDGSPILVENIRAFLHQEQNDRTIVIAPLIAARGAVFGGQESMTESELREDCGVRTPDYEFGFDRSATSTGAATSDESSAESVDKTDKDANVQPTIQTLPPPKRADFNEKIYYRNKLEFSLEGGWHPINIPFPLDFLVGDNYNTYPLKYTLVPIFASLRWHVGGLWGPKVLRGNFDFTFTGTVTGVARGPESRYFAYLMGIRRNFVPRNWRVAPYFDMRFGVGRIDAKGPKGVLYAQGQDITFTLNMGSGVRYNFSPRFALSGGLNYMHISNLDLSESNGKPNWGVRNYGINVYGPMVGLDIQLRRHSHQSE